MEAMIYDPEPFATPPSNDAVLKKIAQSIVAKDMPKAIKGLADYLPSYIAFDALHYALPPNDKAKLDSYVRTIEAEEAKKPVRADRSAGSAGDPCPGFIARGELDRIIHIECAEKLQLPVNVGDKLCYIDKNHIWGGVACKHKYCNATRKALIALSRAAATRRK
jgi:hypothetical protein